MKQIIILKVNIITLTSTCFYYDKSSKNITIHIIHNHKEYDNEGNLMLWSDWSTKKYKTEKPALKALSTCIRNLKEYNNLWNVLKINEDF